MKKKPNIKRILANMSTYSQFTFVRQENTAKKDKHLGTPIPRKIVAVLSVGEKGWGFGEIAFIQDCKTGQLYLDTEDCGKEKVLHFLKRLVEGAITDVDKDPVKHKQYNKFTGVISCGCCGYRARSKAAKRAKAEADATTKKFLKQEATKKVSR